jgi:hypothetical protein
LLIEHLGQETIKISFFTELAGSIRFNLVYSNISTLCTTL